MNIIIEKPQQKAIDLNFIKNHLRVIHDYDDEYLNIILDIATEILEKHINMSILKKKYKYIAKNTRHSTMIELPLKNFCQITSVRSNKNDIEYTTSYVNKKTYIAMLQSITGIEIEYYAGIVDSNNDIPNDLKYAIIQIVAGIYNSFNENILESPYIKHIIKSYRDLSIN